jgi:hypothetical protein
LKLGSHCDRTGVPGQLILAPRARLRPVPRADVRLLGGLFQGNQQRNLACLLFLEPDPDAVQLPGQLRALRAGHAYRRLGEPCLEDPRPRDGHPLSALAWAYAGTGTNASDPIRRALAGGRPGTQGLVPYYMIHKYLAGLIDHGHRGAGSRGRRRPCPGRRSLP